LGGQSFRLTVKQLGAELYLSLTGDFDVACVGRVEAALKRISAARTSRVIFDLRRVDFMDSAALRTILRANDRARSASFDLVVVRPRGLANRVFTLTRAGRQLRLVHGISQPSSHGASEGWTA